MEVAMNTNGRRLWMHAAGMFTGMLFLGMACETTVFASGTVPADASGQITALVETVPADVLQEDTVQEPESEADVLTTEGTDAASAKEQTEEIQKAARTAVEEQVKAAQEAAAAQAKAVQEAAAAQAKAAQEAAAKAAQEAAEAAAQAAMVDAILAQNGVSRQEYDLLAALIQCEAGGESYIGQVAVGNVVMNRVESSNHPNTISEVIYAAGQFSPVRNGSLSRTLSSGNISASCRQAALEAIAGSEPVGDKLYFRRVNGRSGQVIGNHVFY
jgi:spore germination cell wall hydrolase CwlJ-like protein